ncbi:MAG TPA: SPOR domain-containing protein [Candidatus Acidoferrum sp.]|jgi:cell division septation protein DedD|nr:SPOR domain-containing protein [Candidatus Acidoferrum sp.]
MASRGNRGGGGDRVLESRHVIGLFLLMLVFSGVFFALGYVMGRNQYDGQVRAENTPRATPDPVFTSKSDLAARRKKDSQSSANPSNASNSANSSSSAGSGWGSLSTPAPSASQNSRDTNSASSATPDDGNAPASDWSFYNSGKNTPDDRLKTAPPNATAQTTPAPAAVPSTAMGKNPRIGAASVVGSSQVPAGSYVLQVAAMRQSVDANAVVTSLRTKHFPAFVVNPTTDKYYHVQVGPYHDVKSADVAKKGLESAGFKAIVKH